MWETAELEHWRMAGAETGTSSDKVKKLGQATSGCKRSQASPDATNF